MVRAVKTSPGCERYRQNNLLAQHLEKLAVHKFCLVRSGSKFLDYDQSPEEKVLLNWDVPGILHLKVSRPWPDNPLPDAMKHIRGKQCTARHKSREAKGAWVRNTLPSDRNVDKEREPAVAFVRTYVATWPRTVSGCLGWIKVRGGGDRS